MVVVSKTLRKVRGRKHDHRKIPTFQKISFMHLYKLNMTALLYIQPVQASSERIASDRSNKIYHISINCSNASGAS
jgi:hypothetical protein